MPLKLLLVLVVGLVAAFAYSWLASITPAVHFGTPAVACAQQLVHQLVAFPALAVTSSGGTLLSLALYLSQAFCFKKSNASLPFLRLLLGAC